MESPANQIYGDYAQALALCEGVGYALQDLTDVVIQKNIAARQAILKSAVLDQEASRTLLGVSFAMNSRSLRVIDFGGGGGHHQVLAAQALGEDCKIWWNIVETSAMCQSAKAIHTPGLKFFDTIAAAKEDLGNVDLVMASSSLQYCPDPLGYLDQLLAISAKYLYITRTPLSLAEKSLVSIQSSLLSHNGPGPLPQGYEDRTILYPITYVPLRHVEERIQQKYRIRFRLLEQAPNLSVDGMAINTHFGLFCELQ